MGGTCHLECPLPLEKRPLALGLHPWTKVQRTRRKSKGAEHARNTFKRRNTNIVGTKNSNE